VRSYLELETPFVQFLVRQIAEIVALGHRSVNIDVACTLDQVRFDRGSYSLVHKPGLLLGVIELIFLYKY
jgi:hypothetical protein